MLLLRAELLPQNVYDLYIRENFSRFFNFQLTMTSQFIVAPVV